MDQKQIDSAQKKQAEDMASVPTNNDFFCLVITFKETLKIRY